MTSKPNVVPKIYRLKKSKNNGGPIFNKETPNNGLIKIIAGTIPINVLNKIIASLHDKDNKITIPGFYNDVIELSKKERERSNDNENIYGFPLDVTDKSKCKEVFKQIKDKFQNVDICFFSTGTWNPKKEKDIDVEQIEDVFKVNFFGTLNSIKACLLYTSPSPRDS